MENKEKSVIQEFYKGANVFLTGGTGFMGKALIEKLLRDTEVETIYVLIREKKGQTPHMRIDSLFDDVVSGLFTYRGRKEEFYTQELVFFI